MDEDELIAGPSGLQHEATESGQVFEPDQESSSDEGSEYDESGDEQGHVQFQPAENEIEGDFEYVCPPWF